MISKGRIKCSTFEDTVSKWGSVGIVYPDDAQMIISAYSSDYLLVSETHNTSGRFETFRCFGLLQLTQLAIAPSGTVIKGCFYYITR